MEPDSIEAKIGLAATITQILVEGSSSSPSCDELLAERRLREVLERDAHHPMARAQMALLRRVQNRLNEAQAEAELAVSLDHNNELALKQLGQIMLFQGEPAAGIPHLEKAIRLNPRGPNLWSINGPWDSVISCSAISTVRYLCSGKRAPRTQMPITFI